MKNNKNISILLIVIIIILITGGFYFFKKETVVAPAYSQNSPEQVAEKYVRENSVGKFEFTLEESFNTGNFVKFSVIPKGESAETMDEAQIFLKKKDGSYEVIGFGTAFPELEKNYPELKGKI